MCLFRVDGVGRAARAGDVASAGAAGLRAETCVARGRWVMLLAASSLPCILVVLVSAAARRVLLPRDAGSNAFRRAREELSTTDGAHVHNAADGCSLPEPHDHLGAKPGAHSRGCPSRRRAREEAAQNSPSSAEAAPVRRTHREVSDDGRARRRRARRRDDT